jgi:hypothetical protein
MAKRRERVSETEVLEMFNQHLSAAGGSITHNALVDRMEAAGQGQHVLMVVKLANAGRIKAVVQSSIAGDPESRPTLVYGGA